MFTHEMFKLIEYLDYAKGFLWTLQKLGLVTEREAQVLNHQMHSQILEKVRRLK